MYKQLNNFLKRPEPFSRMTTKELWTRPYLAQQMLRFHLDDATELASRKPETIATTVNWINSRLSVSGKQLCDLGCGPGLYADRFARAGARVTGIDFSSSSIEFARQQAESNKLPIDYLVRDYLIDSLPNSFDVVTLIYCDYCAIAPDSRGFLLENIFKMLRPGGYFVFDVYATESLSKKEESTIIQKNLMNGFWSQSDYIGLQNSLIYSEELASLDHYLIVEEAESFEIYNWLQYFSTEGITEELKRSGFDVEVMAGSLSEEVLTSESETMGIIAKKK